MLIIYLNERNTFLEHLNDAGMRISRKSGVLTSIEGKETGSLIKTFHKENSSFRFTGKFYIIKEEIILVLIFPSNKKIECPYIFYEVQICCSHKKRISSFKQIQSCKY